MATWEDGPEYAPAERPARFSEPEVEPLDVAPPYVTLSEGAPVSQPEFHQELEVTPLDQHEPPLGETRDPNQAFDVASAAITEASASAWSAAHSVLQPSPAMGGQAWPPPTPPGPGEVPHPEAVMGPPQRDPHTPMTISGNGHGLDFPPPSGLPAGGFPAPGQPQWFGPGPQQPAPQRPSLIQAVTQPVLIPLLIGVLCWIVPWFFWVAPLAFLTAFLGAGRVEYQRAWVRNVFLIAGGVQLTVLVVGLLGSPDDLLGAFALLCGFSSACCLFTLATVLGLVSTALRRGDAPERRERQTGWT